MKPFLVIENKITKNYISIYSDGRVYGKERGQLLGKLSNDSMRELNALINNNMYMFKTLTKFFEGLNPYSLHVYDESRKQRKIIIEGWSQMPYLIRILHNTVSLQSISI